MNTRTSIYPTVGGRLNCEVCGEEMGEHITIETESPVIEVCPNCDIEIGAWGADLIDVFHSLTPALSP